MDKAEAAEVARKTLEILDRDGWCKGFLTMPTFDGKQYHCIGGAWNLAHHQHDMWVSAGEYEALARVIREQFPGRPVMATILDDISLIAYWNNDLETTEADVRMVLEKIAAA